MHTYQNRAQELVTSVNRIFDSIFIEPLKPLSESSTTSKTSNAYAPNTKKVIRPSQTAPVYSRNETFESAKGIGEDEEEARACVPIDMPSICMGIRTYAGATPKWISVMLQGLVVSHQTSRYRDKVNLLFYVINTDHASPTFMSSLEDTVDAVNALAGRCAARIVWNPSAPVRVAPNSMYGYDESDMLLSFLEKQHVCQYLVFTNGDNMYNARWFDAVAKEALEPSLSIVGWDFVSHHPRGANMTEQAISVKLKRKFVDLGSVLIRKRDFIESRVKFLPYSVFTPDLYARDIFTISGIMAGIKNISTQTKLIHRILLFHQ